MKKNLRALSRRDFLKAVALTSAGLLARPLWKAVSAAGSSQPNIIIIVFDAWAYHDTSLYGYKRQTTPNMQKFAEQATVYHRHYSAGTFTVPGVSSLLTGLYPWTHRAMQIGAGMIAEQVQHNIFAALSSTHSTLAYSQNTLADQILCQMDDFLDVHIPSGSFNANNSLIYTAPIFRNDAQIAYASFEDNIVQKGTGYDASLFLGPMYRTYSLRNQLRNEAKFWSNYPRGVPGAENESFVLSDVVDGAIEILKSIQSPTIAYLHFHPPHGPYNPTKQFFRKFLKGWRPPIHPFHPLSGEKNKKSETEQDRRSYNEYLASWDNETARLFDYLEKSGLKENSYIFFTSDHGEMFDRGEIGHITPLLSDPLVHVPLIVSRPGQKTREDVHDYTSSVDILPTIAHLTDNPLPVWSEGRLLPGLGGTGDVNRSIWSMDAKLNSSFSRLVDFSFSLTRGKHRLMYYTYGLYKGYEFYDLENDPYEMKDLYLQSPGLALDMQVELMQKIEEANTPYQ
jgi:arylsulfatase A-like enzyme